MLPGVVWNVELGAGWMGEENEENFRGGVREGVGKHVLRFDYVGPVFLPPRLSLSEEACSLIAWRLASLYI